MVIFLVVFAAAVAAVFAWDYRAQQAKRPPSPEVIAGNLIQGFVGPDTLKSLTYDKATGRLEAEVVADTFKPDAKTSIQDQKDILAGAGEIAARRVLQVVSEVRVVVVHLGYEKTRLATVTLERGKAQPTVVYTDALK